MGCTWLRVCLQTCLGLHSPSSHAVFAAPTKVQGISCLRIFTPFECSPLPSFDELASVTALLGGSSFVSQSKQHAVIILFSLFAHSTEFFPARDQVLEQCLCDCHCGNLSTQYSAQLWPSLRGTLCNHREAQLCSQSPPQPADAGSHDLRLRLESPSSTRLEALVPSRDSRARTRSPSPPAWRPDFPGAAREAP